MAMSRKPKAAALRMIVPRLPASDGFTRTNCGSFGVVAKTVRGFWNYAGIIIVIVLVLLVIVGAVVCVLLLNGNKEDKKEDTNAKIQDEKKEEEEQPTGGLDEQAKARNAVREIDLERIIRAAGDYMTNKCFGRPRW